MATVPFSQITNRVLSSVPGCPTPLVERHVAEAVRRSCERSLAWRYAPAPFNLSPGVHEYHYRKPAGTEVHALFLASINGYALKHLTLDDAVRQFPAWAKLYNGVPYDVVWSETPSSAINTSALNEAELNGGEAVQLPDEVMATASTPRAITQITPDKFIVLPLPDDGTVYKLQMVYALVPTPDATSMDATAFYELEDAIFHNTLQHLLVLPDSPWNDTRLATYHGRQFLREVNERRARANLGNMRGSLRASLPNFV